MPAAMAFIRSGPGLAYGRGDVLTALRLTTRTRTPWVRSSADVSHRGWHMNKRCRPKHPGELVRPEAHSSPGRG